MGLHRDGAGQGRSLQLAAGQFLRASVQQGHFKLGQLRGHGNQLPGIAPGNQAGDGLRHGSANAPARHEGRGRVLRDPLDQPALVQLDRAPWPDPGFSVHLDLACGRRTQTEDDFGQGTLPGPGFSGDGQCLAGGQAEGQWGQDLAGSGATRMRGADFRNL